MGLESGGEGWCWVEGGEEEEGEKEEEEEGGDLCESHLSDILGFCGIQS